MNPEEYLPPATEPTAITIPEASEVEPREELIRIQCAMCYKEFGYHGLCHHALDLIEKRGWKIGRQITCPDCVEKTARKFFKKYSEPQI